MFSYRVSSLIGNKESSPTGWYKIPVPPRVDTATLPTLAMVEKNNDSVEIVVNNNDKNRRCEVRYSNDIEKRYMILLTRLRSIIYSMVIRKYMYLLLTYWLEE